METQVKLRTPGLNGNALKLIAIAAMTIDHLAWVIFPGYGTEWWLLLLHTIGRLTAPIMCFFIAEGYHYTRDVKKYALRLFAFSIVSHFAYNFAFGIPFLPFSTGSALDQTSVMWALAWGLVALALCDEKRVKMPQWARYIVILAICAISFCADWSCIAVLVIVHFGLNRGQFKKQMIGLPICVLMYTIVYCIFIDVTYGLLQMLVVLCIPFLKQYNGERGKWRGMKWLFYIYYPAHLVLCGIIRLALGYGAIR